MTCHKNKTTLRPLCIDLDGTLISTDMLWESVCLLLKKNPLLVFCFPIWLTSGIARLKAEVARRVTMDVTTLPYNTQLIEYLHQQRTAGHRVELVTGSNEAIANQIANHLQLFDRVSASSDETNLTGSAKARLLESIHGNKGFDYAGNESKDDLIWSISHSAIVVSRSQSFIHRKQTKFPVQRIFKVASASWKDYIHGIRLHQWIKNLLLFFPLLLDGRLFDSAAWGLSLLAFIIFGFIASGTYILNDLLDLKADRLHRDKQHRPFASGSIPIPVGFALLLCLIGSGLLLSVLLMPTLFTWIVCAYLMTTLSYSLWLKAIPVTDVCTLAALYTIRLIAGTVAISAAWSFWLLAFSIFFFLSLAFAKRSSELSNIAERNLTGSAHGRGYQVQDLSIVNTMGVASGYLSVLVIALYVNSDSVAPFYSSPQILWLVCPILLYWISRIWLITARGSMDEDPIVFAIKDITSWAFGALAVACIVLAARVSVAF